MLALNKIVVLKLTNFCTTGAILLLKRWMLALKLRELELYAHYDYFILTRAGVCVRYINKYIHMYVCMYVYTYVCMYVCV
jgi:hypothetical protein